MKNEKPPGNSGPPPEEPPSERKQPPGPPLEEPAERGSGSCVRRVQLRRPIFGMAPDESAGIFASQPVQDGNGPFIPDPEKCECR